MTDRELLELAAKAAGYEIVGIAHKFIVQGIDEDDLLVANDRGGDSVWNPITDDGDALRLAAKLRLTIRQDDPAASEAGIAAYQTGAPTVDGIGPWFWKEWLRDHSDDRSVTTRRAIVRAAAEIGKAVQKPIAP